jgi:hypothetical protein
MDLANYTYVCTFQLEVTTPVGSDGQGTTCNPFPVMQVRTKATHANC